MQQNLVLVLNVLSINFSDSIHNCWLSRTLQTTLLIAFTVVVLTATVITTVASTVAATVVTPSLPRPRPRPRRIHRRPRRRPPLASAAAAAIAAFAARQLGRHSRSSASGGDDMELQPLAGHYVKMENAGFEQDDSRGCCSPAIGGGVGGGGSGGGSGGSTVEMSEVLATAVPPPSLSPTSSPSPTSPAPPLLSVNGNGSISCSEHCQSLHLQHQKYYQEKGEAPAPESPWHHLKTIFLVGTLVFLALWVLVYTLLSQFAVL